MQQYGILPKYIVESVEGILSNLGNLSILNRSEGIRCKSARLDMDRATLRKVTAGESERLLHGRGKLRTRVKESALLVPKIRMHWFFAQSDHVS